MNSLSDYPATVLSRLMVIDDFLSPPLEENSIDQLALARGPGCCGRYNWLDRKDVINYSSEIWRFFCAIQRTLDLPKTEISGIELWANIFKAGEQIHMHIDCDENEYKDSKVLKYPLATIVLYGCSTGLKGGNLVFDDGISIQPIANRAVIFHGSRFHAVQPVQKGIRKSVQMLLWGDVPKAYKLT